MDSYIKYLSVGYTCTGTNDNVVYAVDPAATHAEIHSIVISNTSTEDKTSTVKWSDFSSEEVSSISFWGDGNTLKDSANIYTSYSLITDGIIPNGASLQVTDGPLFLGTKDFITVSSSSSNSISVIVVMSEHFNTTQDSNVYSLDLETINTQVTNNTY